MALLKELGAPPSLTVQIQGEALLNDGTAIVLFTVANNMLKGEDYSGGDIFIYLMKTALMYGLYYYCNNLRLNKSQTSRCPVCLKHVAVVCLKRMYGM